MADRPAPPALATRDFVAGVAGLFVVYMFGWITRWTFDPTREFGLPNDWFFTAQADAMLRGRLWVDPAALSPGAWTVDGNECFWINDHCYGYFGLVPSLLRIPMLLFFVSSTTSLANLMIPVAAGVALYAALDLCRRQTAGLEPMQANVFMGIAAVALGPGSVLVLLADPYVYQEAIIWSVAFVMLAINLFWRWWNGGPNVLLVATALACTAASGTRVTTTFVGPLLAVAVVLRLRTTLFTNRRLMASVAALVIAPAVLSLGGLYLKFGQFSTPLEAYQIAAPTVGSDSEFCTAAGGGRPAPENLPTNLVAYLRPDSARVMLEASPVRFRFSGCEANAPTLVWPRTSFIGYYPEEHTSITTTMPLATLITAFVAVMAVRRRRLSHLWLLVAVASSLIFIVTLPAITARYLGEFYPLVVTGLALSTTYWSASVRGQRRIWLATLAAASLVWSAVAVASLFTGYAWIYL